MATTRSPAIGDPTCTVLLADEGALLYVLRACRSDAGAARATLVELCAEPRAGALLPLAVSLAEATGLSRRA